MASSFPKSSNCQVDSPWKWQQITQRWRSVSLLLLFVRKFVSNIFSPQLFPPLVPMSWRKCTPTCARNVQRINPRRHNSPQKLFRTWRCGIQHRPRHPQPSESQRGTRHFRFSRYWLTPRAICRNYAFTTAKLERTNSCARSERRLGDFARMHGAI